MVRARVRRLLGHAASSVRARRPESVFQSLEGAHRAAHAFAVAHSTLAPHLDLKEGTHRSGLADLRSNRFAGDDDFHTPVFLPPLVGAVVRNGFSLAQANGCYRVCDQSLLDEKLAHGVPALLGKLHVRFIAADIVRMSFDGQMQARDGIG